MSPTQQNRRLAITTALGKDVLLIRSISVVEQISRPFQIEAELSSEDGEIDFDAVIGHEANLRLDIGQNSQRYFHGYVSKLVQVANQGGYAHYRATIVPWLWLLTRTSDCRTWVTAEETDKGKTVPEMIEAVFKARGFSDYKLKLSGTYPKREFCVQYRETDFNFVSRLMEQEGIYYFFQHENGKHTLVLADSISASKSFPGYDQVAFAKLGQGAARGREVITDWVAEKEVQPVAYALNDFDFKKPKNSLLASSNVTRKYGHAQFEIYDYPGQYVANDEGQQLADARLDELQSQYKLYHGQTSARGIAPGCTFAFTSHPRHDQNGEYLITGIALQANAGEFATGAAEGEGEFFSCQFTAIEKSQQFRPPRLTPVPRIHGVQTAIVTGPAGQEIYVDKYGRVKIQFHWDRYGKFDENSSCWVRVSQSWTGKGWGHIANPHMLEEVIVSFLEGDPDRPIIVGRVYNEDHMPPYPLPEAAAVIGMKSQSTKTTSKFNIAKNKSK